MGSLERGGSTVPPADLQLVQAGEAAVAQRGDGVVLQVELHQGGAGREGAVRERRQAVGPQTENAQGGQNLGGGAGHPWNLENHISVTLDQNFVRVLKGRGAPCCP